MDNISSYAPQYNNLEESIKIIVPVLTSYVFKYGTPDFQFFLSLEDLKESYLNQTQEVIDTGSKEGGEKTVLADFLMCAACYGFALTQQNTNIKNLN